MGLLSKLKSLFGAGDGDRSAGSGVDVTVERDPSADAEQAGGETTTAGDEPADAATATEDHPADPSEADEEPHIEEAEPETGAESETEAEPEPEADAEADTTDVESAAEDEELTVEAGQETEDADAAEEAELRAESGDGEPVLELKGIGPAYAERLEEAGVTTVAGLAEEDPEDLADRVDLSAKRVGRWVDRAKDRR